MSPATRHSSLVQLLGGAVLVGALLLGGCAPGVQGGSGATAGSSGMVTDSSSAAVTLRLARAARAAGDTAMAADLYAKLAGPGASSRIMVEYGDTLVAGKRYQDAIETFGRVEARHPADVEAILGLVRAHLGLGEAAVALDLANRAQAVAPRDSRVLVDRGAALDSLGRHTEAQASYRAALQIAPRSVAAHNNLALSLALAGQYHEAIALLSSLARASSATPQIRENLALVLGLSGDSQRAAEVSRMDLSEKMTAANLEFYAAARGAQP